MSNRELLQWLIITVLLLTVQIRNRKRFEKYLELANFRFCFPFLQDNANKYCSVGVPERERRTRRWIATVDCASGENWKFHFTQRDLPAVREEFVCGQIKRWSAVISLPLRHLAYVAIDLFSFIRHQLITWLEMGNQTRFHEM